MKHRQEGKERKWHYYSFCWFWTDVGQSFYANTYSGFSDHYVTLASINRARESANDCRPLSEPWIPSRAVVMSISYLGHMTSEDFREGECEKEEKDE
jgi:hypothetical protein